MWTDIMALAAMALVVGACDGGDGGRACTLIGCAADGVRIELEDASGGIPAGVYRVTATSVEGTQQCDFTLPASGIQPTCRVGDAGVTWFGFAPTTVTIVVTRNQQPAHSDAHAVTYSETRPNGPGCDPVCHDGVLTITLP